MRKPTYLSRRPQGYGQSKEGLAVAVKSLLE
jgi:hypothetical protein